MVALTCYVDNQLVASTLNPRLANHPPIVREATIAHFGISVALLTPFHGDGRLNLPLMSQHANQLLDHGLKGITLFGTTGEGASIGMNERQSAIRALLDSGLPADCFTLGLCATAISDVARQVQQGVDLGINRFLLLPPFYFKGLDDDGLFDWHTRLLDAADPSAEFILYHIPQITQVPLSLELITRLRAAFPDRVVALKDSAGQWSETRAVLEQRNIPVLVGDERLLHKAAAMGGAGSICGMANLHPARLTTLFETHRHDAALSADVDLIVSYPVIPALKQAMVAMTGNPDWGHVRAPLRPLGSEARTAIATRFAQTETVA